MTKLVVLITCVSAVAFGSMPASSTSAAGAQKAAPGKVRTYYIAADDVTWDYAPGTRTESRVNR
jgi:hypothetical protein